MKFQRISIQGFRSFNAEQSLDLSILKSGVYHVAGKNLIEPELEANGSGKSSLFEAFGWALHGKTSGGLRAATIQNWSNKNQCAVLLEMETQNKKQVSVLRTWKPNLLEFSDGGVPAPVDQQELELKTLSPDVFLYSIYFAQFASAFIDLDSAKQAAIFGSILNLSVWDKAAQSASEETKKIETLLQNQKQILAQLLGQAEELLKVDYKEQETRWQKEHDKTVVTAVSRVQTAEEGKAASKTKLTKYLKQTEQYKSTQEEAQQKTQQLIKLQSHQSYVSDTIAQLTKKNITNCPVCKQPVDSSHIKDKLNQTLKDLEKIKSQVSIATKEQTELLSKIPQNWAVTLRELEREDAGAENSVLSSKQQVQNLQKEKNPYTKLKQESELRGEQLAEKIETEEQSILKNEHRVVATQYWVKGFKEVRLSVIQESLDQLTIETNEVLFQMGLRDWAVQFDIEKENKSGSVSRGFTTLVYSPHTKDPVPLGAWSGGESQRLRLAISIGFSNLVANRTGISSNLEMWDESTTWLSHAGIQDLLAILATRAEQQNKIILLADHRVLDFGGFAGVITVTKTEEGSSITVTV